jgi:hypothetical protein
MSYGGRDGSFTASRFLFYLLFVFVYFILFFHRLQFIFFHGPERFAATT